MSNQEITEWDRGFTERLVKVTEPIARCWFRFEARGLDHARPIDADVSLKLAARRTGDNRRVAFGAPPHPALRTLAAGAAGNPRLLSELVGGLRDDDAVRVTDGRATLTSARLPGRMHRAARTGKR